MESAPPWGYASVNAAKTRTTGFLTARRILTLDPAHSGDAIWWEDGRIRRVGTAAQLARAVPRGTPSYELPDALVTPGFVDGHTHFALWALGRRRVQLAGCASRDDAIRRVAQATPMQGWVIGQGWDANNWEHPPERATLDAVRPDRCISIPSTSTPPGSTVRRSPRQASPGRRGSRSAGGSCAMVRVSQPACCWSARSS